MPKKIVALLCVMALVAGMVVGHFAWSPIIARTETLSIFHAGSLSVPLEELGAEFERTHPNVDVLTESAGSAATIRKVTELGKTCDIIVSADYTLIPNMMYRAYADWYIAFARNEMVLGYRDGAPGADAILDGARTWRDVFRNDDVKYGHSNPDADPCGYRALMVIQLAEKHYNEPGLYYALIHGADMDKGRESVGREMVRPKEVDLIALMEAGELDYMFQYKSVCVQHRIPYINLDDAINLSSLDYANFYGEASVVIQKSPEETQTLYGKPIVYGVTIPKNAPNRSLAMEFIAFLLSKAGQDIMGNCGQPSITPAPCDHPENLPMPITQATP